MKRLVKFVGICGLILFTHSVNPGVGVCAAMEDILKSYFEDVGKGDPSFKGFDAEKGRQFYHAIQTVKDGKKLSCATCHTEDPRRRGLLPTGKTIEPMAPAVNPQRFTDRKKVEKWFKRNCMDVYQRLCSSKEKGDFIKYLQSFK